MHFLFRYAVTGAKSVVVILSCFGLKVTDVFLFTALSKQFREWRRWKEGADRNKEVECNAVHLSKRRKTMRLVAGSHRTNPIRRFEEHSKIIRQAAGCQSFALHHGVRHSYTEQLCRDREYSPALAMVARLGSTRHQWVGCPHARKAKQGCQRGRVRHILYRHPRSNCGG
jgi:hypothetical protein